MLERDYHRLGETIVTETLDNGLTVFLLPKHGFQQVFATFTTRYGSVDQTFAIGDSGQFVTVPDGIAHFLEHKMFESEQGDVFHEFAKHGASANAFTTFDHTTYLFSGTEDILTNLETLLDFVQDPYFTDENVEKEKGIIGQEIRMYDDNPDWRGYFGLLKALYHDHPVRVDIAGTVESIAEIDRATLYRCYEAFYHPANMILFVVGGLDVHEMMNVIRKNQAGKTFLPFPGIERRFPQEADAVHTPRTIAELSVSQPRCLVGWKDAERVSGRDLLRRETLMGVILDTAFGRSSATYHEWIDDQLIDQQFSWEYECTPMYGHALVGGNTPRPDELLTRMNQRLAEMRETGLPAEEFERCRKKAIGRFMASLDSLQYIGREYTSTYLKGADLFDSLEILEQLTLQDANEQLISIFVPERQATSLVLPKE